MAIDLTNPYAGASTDDLDSILTDPNVDKKTRDLAKQVRSMERSVGAAGLDPQLTEPRSSLFGNILDTIDAPRQGVAGVVDTLLRGDMFEDGVGTGWRRGQKENTTASDIFRGNDIIDNPVLRGVAGFAADIFTDPLTYLSFGTGQAARVGGRALTEAGFALKGAASERLLANGVKDVIAHGDALDETFKAINRYQDSSTALKAATNPTVRALELDRMAKAKDIFGKVFSPEEVLGQEIFAKPNLKVGVNVPFLGHLTGEGDNIAKEVLLQEPGPVGQAMRLAGKVFKPGRVNIGDFDISPTVLDAFDNVRMFGNAKLAKVAQEVGKLESAPLLGAGIKGAKTASDAVVNTFSKANEMFKKTFYQKALIGADASTNRLNYLDLAAGAKVIARDKTYEALGEDLLKNKDLQKEVMLAIDAQAVNAMKPLADAGNKDLLETINRIRTTQKATEGDQLTFRQLATQSGAEQNFRAGIDNLLKDPTLSPDLKAGITKTLGAMDDLAIEEKGSGLGYTALEYYLPHRYIAADGARLASSKSDSFLQKRTYDTLGQAFEQSGKVGNTDLASLLNYRFEKSLTLRAQRNYAQRLAVEEGLDPTLVKKLYQEALIDPQGAAGQAMKRYGFKVKPLDPKHLADGAYIAERQKIYAKIGLGDTEAARTLSDHAAEYQQKINEELWSAGRRPLDNQLPQASLGEIGESISIPGGGEVFLPKQIADSYKETVAARDILKDSLSGSAFGTATLKALDHASATFKKWVTLPFPAYWGQNLLGDRFNQAMGGVHAMDPGIFARTHSVLAGKSAIKSVHGMTLDKPALDRVIKSFGMNYSVGDFLGTVDSFGDMNIDRFLATKNTLLENIGKGNVAANRQAALQQLHDKFQKTFDGFARVSQFVHRFEKGDSISDAVRNANQMYFNYRDLSPVEQSLFRRFYMFYGYMSKATKQTVTNLMTNPGNLTLQLHGTNALSEFFSDPNAAPTAEMLDHKLLGTQVQNEQLTRAVGKNAEGKPIFARGFAAPLNAVMQQFTVNTPRNYSVGELVSAVGDSAQRTIQKQFAMANPAINAAAQLISGKNLYFNKPLDSEFLRKVPSLNAAAEKYLGYKHDDLPLDLDAVTKSFLKAVPDGKGRLIADPARMWILNNLIPGMARLNSMAGNLTNENIPGKTSLLRTGLGINLQDTDPSRTYLSQRRDELNSFMNANSVRQRLTNERDDE